MRPELTGPMQIYVDLHRHAAVRSSLTSHPAVALRLMVAHVIAGSCLWTVRVEPQAARSDEVRESVETSKAEADFDQARRKVLTLLGFLPEEPTAIHGSDGNHGGDRLTRLFLKLLDLTDAQVMDVLPIVMGESLAAGSAVIEAVGVHIGVDMRAFWSADDAFFDLLRDREVLTAIVAEVGGQAVADANAKEKGSVLKTLIRDHLDGANGRVMVEGWVPRWMQFPPAAYSARGGVGTVAAAQLAEASKPLDAPAEPVEGEAEPEAEALAA
jgi:ParB family chromosome partitioning protein